FRLVREPRPIDAGDNLLFPDFALEPKEDGQAWLVELVGFWTPAYLEEKLASRTSSCASTTRSPAPTAISPRKRASSAFIDASTSTPSSARSRWLERR